MCTRVVWCHGAHMCPAQVPTGCARRASTTLILPTRADRCAHSWKHRKVSNGGHKATFRDIGDQWDYVGIMQTVFGSTPSAPQDAWVEVDNVKFMGFPGTDECGRRGVGITNDAAGYGKGRYIDNWNNKGYSSFMDAGKLQTNVIDGNWGGATCNPLVTRRLT